MLLHNVRRMHWNIDAVAARYSIRDATHNLTCTCDLPNFHYYHAKQNIGIGLLYLGSMLIM